MVTNKWVKVKASMGYYKYSNGGGKARHSTNEKKISKYNKYFDDFTDRVDNMKSIENNTLRDVIGLGLIEAAIKMGKDFFLANAKNLIKKFGKGLPIAGLAIALIEYNYKDDKAVTAINKIPGSYYKW
ncbi:hypothetical protein [Heyndrickxia oleronia]|uniref:Uncharacterized protein n=1 Tax=Heyndrickxia oleronia TaxID=38875 RepID=A0AAW6SV86_9BACI|nr:hypothetical protein [Heyndrickxia oleronia]MDH5162730.1 hypothetical protein [Heyndrickxia oleronia]